MSQNVRHHACNPPPPIHSEEDFPILGVAKNPENLKGPTKGFLTIKYNDPEQPNVRMADLNPFLVDKKIKAVIGKKTRHKVSAMPSGLLLIEVDRNGIFERLKSTKKLDDIPVIIEEHKTLNTSKGIIHCDNKEVKEMTNEQLKDAMKDQNVTDVYRIKKRSNNDDDDSLENTDSFIITFGTPNLPNEVRIGYINVEIRLYIPNPRRCFNCQRYGHGKNTCRHEPICAKCAQKGHEHDDCVSLIIQCSNCEQNHKASSKDCPMYKLEKQIIGHKYRSNVTFKEARTKIYNENPKLTSQIPSIKTNIPKTSYSNVAANQTIPIIIQQQLQQQQQQISYLTKQISDLLNILRQSQLNSMTIPTTDDDESTVDTSLRNKRSLSETNLSPTTTKPPKMRDTSSRQEVINRSATNLHQSMEASPSLGAVGGAMDLSVLTPPSHVPPAPPDQVVKEGVKDGSSDPQKDQKGDVSRRKNNGNRPCPKSFKDVKSKTDSGRK